jgi:hypothetical protein
MLTAARGGCSRRETEGVTKRDKKRPGQRERVVVLLRDAAAVQQVASRHPHPMSPGGGGREYCLSNSCAFMSTSTAPSEFSISSGGLLAVCLCCVEMEMPAGGALYISTLFADD